MRRVCAPGAAHPAYPLSRRNRKKQNHIVRRGERRGHGLHVGVLDALELGCGCNETRPCLHGNDQASPLSEAVDPLCGGKIFHCPAHVLLVDLRQRLANGRHVRGIQLLHMSVMLSSGRTFP